MERLQYSFARITTTLEPDWRGSGLKFNATSRMSLSFSFFFFHIPLYTSEWFGGRRKKVAKPVPSQMNRQTSQCASCLLQRYRLLIAFFNLSAFVPAPSNYEDGSGSVRCFPLDGKLLPGAISWRDS